MPIIKVAFYKNYKKTYIDRCVYYFQKITEVKKYAKYTHCEIVIDDNWYSSSFVDDGVRVKKIDFHEENWDMLSFLVTPYEKQKIINFFEKHKDDDYDMIDIFFTQLFNFKLHDKSKWICSEICAEALMLTSIINLKEKSFKYPPSKLYEELIDMKN